MPSIRGRTNKKGENNARDVGSIQTALVSTVSIEFEI